MNRGRMVLSTFAVIALTAACLAFGAFAQGGFSSRADTPAPPLGGTPPVLVPSDVTNPPMGGSRDPGSSAARGLYGPSVVPGALPAPTGIRQLPHGKFIEPAAHAQADGIYVKTGKGALVDQSDPLDIELTSGQLVISVVHPSKVALVSTPLGEVSVQAEGTALITFDNGLLRVFSLIGQNNHVQVALHKGPFAGQGAGLYAVDTSYELAAGTRKVTVADLHPADGIGRRNSRLLSKGFLAVSQISLNSALYASDILNGMSKQPASAREKRITQSIAKMAAVLNYVNGAGGYVTQAKSP